jgi:homotetrameric cytidine deaminase
MNENQLIAKAKEVRLKAYAPYSKFFVGCALQLSDGRIVEGCNVENCSYGLCICAERNAVVTAVALGAKPGDITAVAVVAESPEPIAPCGACRQVLIEFANAQTPVFLHNTNGNRTVSTTVGQLLPMAFTSEHL